MLKKIILLISLLFILSTPIFSDSKDDLIQKLLKQNKELSIALENSNDLIKENNLVIETLKKRIEKDKVEIKDLTDALERNNLYIKDPKKYDLGVGITYPPGGNIIFGFYPFESLPFAFYSSNSIVNIQDKIYFIPSLGIKILF